MRRKLTLVSELARKTAHKVTRDVKEWKSYLDTASRVYKYCFEDQLLIFAQKPEARACAELELWNKRMGRWVKKGTKGIALFHTDERGCDKLRYVFDVSDTRPGKEARTPYLWKLQKEHYGSVLFMLEEQYGKLGQEDFGSCLIEAAERAVEDQWQRVYEEFLRYDGGKFMAVREGEEKEKCFQDTLCGSLKYTLLTRCGLDASAYMEDKELEGIKAFSVPFTLYHLGDALSGLSMEILKEIGQVVRGYDRERLLEEQNKNLRFGEEKSLASQNGMGYTEGRRGFNTLKCENEEGSTRNGRDDLYKERGLPDSGSGSGRGRGTSSSREIWAATPEISGRASSRDLRFPAADRETARTFKGDRAGSQGADGEPSVSDDEEGGRGRRTESAGSDGMAAGGKQPESPGGGNRTAGDRLPVEKQEAPLKKETVKAAGEDSAAFLVAVDGKQEEEHLSLGIEAYSFSLFPAEREREEKKEQKEKTEENSLSDEELEQKAEQKLGLEKNGSLVKEASNGQLSFDFMAMRMAETVSSEKVVVHKEEKKKEGYPEVVEAEESAKTEETLEPENRISSSETTQDDTTPAIESPSEGEMIRRNYRIADDEAEVRGGKTRYHNNVAAIRTLKEIEDKGRLATAEEQEILARYTGWGSLSAAFDPQNGKWEKEYQELKGLLTKEEYESARGTVLNAHYTSAVIINAMYEAVSRMGFVPGNILEPGCGVGKFFGLMPDGFASSHLYGVELDGLTGRITKQLYQKADITIGGFEETEYPDDFFDLAIGNVPFGNYSVYDRRYEKLNLRIHDYFILKALDQVRPGGLMAVVSSFGTMDKIDTKARRLIARKADLLGAVRLPYDAFQAAGAEVTTDILFFQKRVGISKEQPEWVQVGETEDGVPLNQYFLTHPEMVLGKMAFFGRKYDGDKKPDCLPFERADLKKQLATALSYLKAPSKALLQMGMEKQEAARKAENRAKKVIPADPAVRNFSYTEKEGKLYFRENSMMTEVEMGRTQAARIRGMIKIRDSTRNLIELQMKGAGDEEVEVEQAHLNTIYDQYTKEYGLLNGTGNRLSFGQDSSYPLLCSLEVLDEEGNLKGKADMFTKRTVMYRPQADHADTAVEALGISIGERAYVDLKFMAFLMGGEEKIPKIVSDLKGIIFKDPETGPFEIEEASSGEGEASKIDTFRGRDEERRYKGWQMGDAYLSGNVRRKLEKAREAASRYPEFSINVEALIKVQPKDLTAVEISVRIGAPWVDPVYYKQFLFELLKTPDYLQDKFVDVLYAEVSGEWHVKGKNAGSRTDTYVYHTYGTKRVNAYEIFEASLNQRAVQVFDVVEKEGKETRVLNAKETAMARQKQDAIGDAFREWVFKEPERRRELCATYNRLFNSIKPREYDGSHLVLNGMNPEIRLEAHQRNAVARILYGGNTLLAHVVGGGKTYEMTAGAMESKRLGLCNKSLIVVPNHLTEQWGSDILTLYPGAKILVATKKDFQPANRKKFCARIATGDFDAVVIGHSQFEKIPLSPERQVAFLQQQIREIEATISEVKSSSGERFTISQFESAKKRMEERIKRILDRKMDDVVTFEELGVDRLFVDEAHFYKNRAKRCRTR